MLIPGAISDLIKSEFIVYPLAFQVISIDQRLGRRYK